MYKIFPSKELNHKEILLYGFHYNFIFIFFLAFSRDLFLGNILNSSINFTSFSLSILSLYLLRTKNYKTLSAYMLMAIATIPLMILIYANKFENLPIVYFVVLPLGTFFLLEFKQAVILNLIIYTSVSILLYVIYQQNPDTLILNNPPAIINLIFASILIMGFGIFYHLSIDSFIKELVHSNKQKDILLKEVHHRVKNNLNVTASILGLQATGKSDDTQEELAKSKARIEAIAIVHEMLYKQEDFDNINFHNYIHKLTHLIISMFSSRKNIMLKIYGDKSINLQLNIMVQLGLVINEMITNSLKYAQYQDTLEIVISLEKDRDSYTFFYKDNGTDSSVLEEIHNKKGLGLKLINLSVKQFDGELSSSYDDGLKYTIGFKHV